MKYKPVVAILLSLCVGCGSRSQDYTRVLAIENSKIAGVRPGMSVSEVTNIMTSEVMELSVVINPAGQVDLYYCARPAKSDSFKTPDGKLVQLYYYRTGMSSGYSGISDIDSTVVVFLDGKVEAVISGKEAPHYLKSRLR